MKLLTTLIILLCIHATGYAQTVSLSLKGATLEQAFKEIKKQTGYNFVYTRAEIQPYQRVNLEVSNVPVEKALDVLLKDLPLTYTITEGKYIVIKAKQDDKPRQAAYHPISLSGTVWDEYKTPLEGATVIMKEIGRSTITNKAGQFVLPEMPRGKFTLEVMYVGYEKSSFVIETSENDIELTIAMKQSVNALDQTVVIAYGTTTKRLNTGSVGKVTAEEIKKQPVSNPLAALEGRVPGLEITQTNGVPGSAFKVQIRGQNSLSQGSEPLFIIDGVPFAPNNTPVSQIYSAAAMSVGLGLSPFNSLSPQDIESIEVLKDADATAIYGSRGANGVVLITTKKAKIGKTSFSANLYTGASRVTRSMTQLNTQQYLQMRREAFRNDGIEPTRNNAPDLLIWDTTKYTDFKKEFTGGTANTSDAQLSFSGGSERTQMMISAGYHHESTVFPGDFSDNRGSLHFSMGHTTTDSKFNIAMSGSYSSEINRINSVDLTSSINLPPNQPDLIDSSGKLNWKPGGVQINNNPLSYLYVPYTAKTSNLLSHLQMEYKIIPGLILRSSVGYSTISVHEKKLTPSTSINPLYNGKGSSTFADNAYESWIIEPQLEYSRTFGRGKLNILIGGTWQQNTSRQSYVYAYGFSNDALLESVGAASGSMTQTGYSQYNYEAVFARVNYALSEKYIVNLSGRRDGSSRFGPGKQFANFGATGLAWIFSNEPFIKQCLSFLSFGKLRASYGITGNDQIGNYRYLESWTNTDYPYQSIPGTYPSRLYNPDYRWEINKKLEAALELGFLHDRVLFNIAYFRNRSNNQLVDYTLPTQTGFASIFKNFPALVQNTGIELWSTSKVISSNKFSWTLSVNLTIPRNKLVSFPGIENSSYGYNYIVGKSINLLYSHQYEGVDPATGVFTVKDINHDGAIDGNDYAYRGSLNPSFYGGFRNTFSYKGVELDFFFSFRKQKGKTYLASIYRAYAPPPGTMSNQPVDVLKRWQQPGDNTYIQKFTTTQGSDAYNAVYNFGASDGIYGDASFIRLKNVSLSYSLPESYLQKRHLKQVKVFVLCQNLLTITSYKGSDPETQNYFTLPPLRTYTAGFLVTL